MGGAAERGKRRNEIAVGAKERGRRARKREYNKMVEHIHPGGNW